MGSTTAVLWYHDGAHLHGSILFVLFLFYVPVVIIFEIGKRFSPPQKERAKTHETNSLQPPSTKVGSSTQKHTCDIMLGRLEGDVSVAYYVVLLVIPQQTPCLYRP